MIKIRINNDLRLKWSVYRITNKGNILEDFTDATIYGLVIKNKIKPIYYHPNYSIVGDMINLFFPASKQTDIGDYVVTMQYEKDGEYYTVDACDAFTFVDSTCKQSYIQGANGVIVETVMLNSTVDLLPRVGLGGTTEHNELDNLEYENSGHIGFQPSGDYATKDELPDLTPYETKTNAADTYQAKGDYATNGAVSDAIVTANDYTNNALSVYDEDVVVSLSTKADKTLLNIADQTFYAKGIASGLGTGVVPEIQPTISLYVVGVDGGGVVQLSVSKPTQEVVIPWVISTSNSQKKFKFVYTDDGIISSLSAYSIRLYFTSIQTNVDYDFSSQLFVNISGQDRIIGGNLYSNRFTLDNPMVEIPLGNNQLTSDLNRIAGDFFELDLNVTKSSGSPDTANIVSSPTQLSQLIRNGGDVASTNVLDYNGANTRSQSARNRQYEGSIGSLDVDVSGLTTAVSEFSIVTQTITLSSGIGTISLLKPNTIYRFSGEVSRINISSVDSTWNDQSIAVLCLTWNATLNATPIDYTSSGITAFDFTEPIAYKYAEISIFNNKSILRHGE